MTEGEILHDEAWGMGGVSMSQEEFVIPGIMPVIESGRQGLSGWIRFGRDPEKETDSKKKACIEASAIEAERAFREKLSSFVHLLQKGRDVIVTPEAGKVVFTVAAGSLLAVELIGYRGKHLRDVLKYFQKEDEAGKDQESKS